MGLLDFIGGGSTSDPSTDPNAQQQPGFLDRLGGMFGGTQQIDPAMAAQLGIDPQKLQHQLAMQALMRMGAGMAAAGAPHNGHRPTIWEAMAGGFGAAQQGGQDQLQSMLRQAFQTKQISVLDEQQKRQAAQNKANDDLTQALTNGTLDPKFVAAMGMDEGTLRKLAAQDPQKFSAMLMNWNSGNAAFDRETAKDNAAWQRTLEHDAMMERNATLRNNAAIAAQNALPKDIALLPPELRQAAVLAKYGIQVGPDGQMQPPMSKGELTKRDARVAELQDGITKAQVALDAIDAMKQNIESGTYGKSGMVRSFETNLPIGLQPAGIQSMTKDTNNLVLAIQAAQASKGNRNSVLGLKTLQLGKPDPAGADPANIHGLMGNRQEIQTMLDNMTAESEHYGAGGSPTTWATAAAKLRAAKGGGNATGGARPAGLPASAKQASDGRWYDPATGKIYVEN